jgi:hypothetical protein
MNRVRNIALLVPLLVYALTSSAFAAATAHAAAPFIAKRGTIKITFNPSTLASFQKLGILDATRVPPARRALSATPGMQRSSRFTAWQPRPAAHGVPWIQCQTSN